MKKVLSLFLALLLVCSLGVQALAAPLDDRLSTVTRKVKETLGIGDEYADFYGDFYDYGASSGWQLNWSGDEASLSVTADESGKIMRYSRDLKNEIYNYSNEFAPVFSAEKSEKAMKSAQVFLSRVLGADEQVRLEASDALSVRDARTYSFSSPLYVNGVASPVSVWINVGAADMLVSSFSRTDLYETYIGGYPSASPAVSAADAKKTLDQTLGLSLYYVEEDGAAILRYLPDGIGNYVVDAQTGTLIDVNALYEALYREGGDTGSGVTEEAAADMAAPTQFSNAASLTEVELAGVAKLEDIWTEEQLDAAARAITELGISDRAALARIQYTLNAKTSEVSASLSYTTTAQRSDLPGLSAEEFAQLSEDYGTLTIRHSVQMNGKTGTLISCHVNYPYRYHKLAASELSESELTAAAEKFLAKYASAEFEKVIFEADENNAPQCFSTLRYIRHENGVPVSGNDLYVSVDASGHIASFGKSWTDFSSFESTEGILSAEQALERYLNGYTAKLCYTALPVAISPDDPDMEKYISYGYTYLHKMALAYTIQFDRYIYGVDARTGALLFYQNDEHLPAYTDLAGSYAQTAVETLARYGIGLPGDAFKPSAAITQKEMITLFVSVEAGSYAWEMDEDELYSYAASLGILSPADKAPHKQMTRLDVVKTIVKMSGYGKAAELPGIYICKFKDARTLAATDVGYVAIAQGLGIVRGDLKGNFRPFSVATRAECAVMLYNFMSRSL